MNIERIYLQENFMPDPAGDPFKRTTFGIGICINPGENVDHAIEEAQRQIKDYIQKNTHYPEHLHIETRVLPEIQTEQPAVETESLEDMIAHAADLKTLSSFQWLAKSSDHLKQLYSKRLEELNNQ